MTDGAAAFRAFEHARWQSAAGAYHSAFGRLTSQAAAPMLDAAQVGHGSRLLDVASGPGYVAGMGAARGAHATGCDFAPEMVALARKHHPTILFRVEDAERLSFHDGGFDAVTMAFLLGHLSDPDRGIRKAFRVLRPDGRFAATWWQPAERAAAFGVIMGAIRAHGRLDVPIPPGPPFDQFSDPARCHDGLTMAGFEDVRVEPLELSWRVASGEALFDAYLHGTARTAGLLREQTPEAREAIRGAVILNSRAYQHGPDLVLPMPVWCMSGRRPD